MTAHKLPLGIEQKLSRSFHLDLSDQVLKSAIPRLAKDERAMQMIEELVFAVPTDHVIERRDARDLSSLADESVHLVLTSPPYWTLKQYIGASGQLGDVADYDDFIRQLTKVWRECFRVLVPGGRMVVVVGDVCLARKTHGRHAVVPLHASIQESSRSIGFDNLAPIVWHKIANAKFEVGGGGGFLGKPYEPNAVLKNDIEFILMQRKPGGYRKPTFASRLLSIIPEARQREWFQQIWTIPGATRRDHPAPYPVELAERLIRMFSFAGDTVLDPFVGSGTTVIAAARWGRHSIGIDIEEEYLRIAKRRIEDQFVHLGMAAELRTSGSRPLRS